MNSVTERPRLKHQRAAFRDRHVLALLLSAFALAACGRDDEPREQALPAESPSSFLIDNVMLVDGSGSQPVPGAVRVDSSRIKAVGDIQALPQERVIDGGGQALAPGFIDTHSHAGRDLAEFREAVPAVSQGITTAVIGQDGGSPLPLADYFAGLEAAPAAINIASYAGHNSIRSAVMGKDYRRAATAAEVERMETLLVQELEAGALGFSAGLEYDPGIYSDPAEVLQLARLTARHGGRYLAHIRSEDRRFSEALDEIIEIGRRTAMPVQISHFKLAMHSLWGRADEFLARLDEARAEGVDISADLYPYEYWQSDLMVLLPARDITDREEVRFALEEIAPPSGLWMTKFEPQPEYVGKSLVEIAVLRDTDPVTAFMQLIAESVVWSEEHGEDADAIIATSMTEEDIIALLDWPHTNVCTDGGLVDLHPRARGTYPRVLGRYVRELGALTLADAVHRMTGLAAKHMGIEDRGLLQPGMAADLTLFDPDTVIDRATPGDPEALSAGITTVWVNGVEVWNDGTATGNYPGVVIRRQSD